MGLLALAALAACGSNDDPRYRSTELLERPPVLITHKVAAEEAAVDADAPAATGAAPVTEAEPAVVKDDSVVPKVKHKRGLKDDVYVTPSKPPVLNIKQPLGMAWDTLKLALTQSEIKVTDSVRDKGLFFVSYNPKSLFGAVTSLIVKEEKQVIYVITVEPNGQETRVSVKKASEAEQNSELDARSIDQDAADDAEALLYQLFETLHDDLKMI